MLAGLLSAHAVLREEPTFAVGDARLAACGVAGGPFRYQLQSEFTRTPALLDADLYGVWADGLVRVDVGQLKAPFSGEQLVSAADLDLFERAQVVQALAPGRQIGAQLSGGIAEQRFSWAGGVFNGNGRNTVNDGGGLLFVGRVGSRVPVEEGALVLGANVAHSDDEQVELAPIFDDFAGTRLLGGADARLSTGRLIVSSEALLGRLQPDAGPVARPWGLQGTVGVRLADWLTVFGRYDLFRPAPGTVADRAIPSIALAAHPTVTFQIEAQLPVAELTASRGIVDAQITF